MKLRIRSLESKETHKIEVPNTYNLQQLKETIISQLFPSSSSSSSLQHNLLLSLNRKEELCGSSSSAQESLQSLGVTSGDLIYYTRNPYAFGNPNLSHFELGKSEGNSSRNNEIVNLMITQNVETGNFDELDRNNVGNRDLMDTQMGGSLKLSNPSDHSGNLGNTQVVDSSKVDEFSGLSDPGRELMGALSNPSDHSGNLGNTQMVDSFKVDELSGSSTPVRELMGALSNPSDHSGSLGKTQMDVSTKVDELSGSSRRAQELMDKVVEGSLKVNEEKSIGVAEEGDEMEVDGEYEVEGSYKFSVPSFLKKVFVKEVGDDSANGDDHKLLVIAIHAVLLESGFVAYDPVSGMKVDGFHLADVWPSLAFGLTLYYTLPEVSTSEVVDTVILKFRTLGKFVNVYGSLPKKGFRVHRVCLDEPRFLPALSFIWKRSDYTGSQNEMVRERKLYPNQEIFEFWKIVKDGLSYPLLIDLCEQVGIVPPSCFMRLPTELKLKILESLPATDVARVECVCSELRFIASNNDLWRLKYEEEFGNAADSQRECQWKAKFSSVWEIRKKRKRFCIGFQPRQPLHFMPLYPARRDPNPFGSPFIIGGDYDRLPTFGLPQHPGRRIFRTNCDLGRLDL